MALFPWKKSSSDKAPAGRAASDGKGDGAGDTSESRGKGDFVPQPEKARKWFDYGRNAADTSNFEYALTCYANGIKLDPDAMSAHEAMYEVAVKHMGRNGPSATGKEIKLIDDGTQVGRFAAAEFAWMKDLTNAALAINGRLDDAGFVAGFGSNGGEEFLSYMNIGETLASKGGQEWEKFDKSMTENLNKIQNDDGSWSGHHCITGKSFCTSAALLVLMVDRSPQPTFEKLHKR